MAIKGLNEVIGLDEIVNHFDFRVTTVQCISQDASVYFIKREHFVDCVNMYKFSDNVLNEQIFLHGRNCDRISKTISF
jgi:hypothetical protein